MPPKNMSLTPQEQRCLLLTMIGTEVIFHLSDCLSLRSFRTTSLVGLFERESENALWSEVAGEGVCVDFLTWVLFWVSDSIIWLASLSES